MENTVVTISPSAVPEKRIRVAAYCRVSSDSSDQLHSLSAQVLCGMCGLRLFYRIDNSRKCKAFWYCKNQDCKCSVQMPLIHDLFYFSQQMVFRYQRLYIYNNWLAPCVSSPVFHENTPVSSIIAETREVG